MRKTISILAAVTAAVTATATVEARAPRQSFTHEGYTYIYSSQVSGDHQVISGRRYPSGTPFRLVVRGDRVSGFAGGYPVSFRATQATGAAREATGIQTAAR